MIRLLQQTIKQFFCQTINPHHFTQGCVRRVESCWKIIVDFFQKIFNN